MPQFQYKKVCCPMLFSLGLIATSTYAETIDTAPLAPEDHSVEAYQKISETVLPIEENNLETDLPSLNDQPRLSKEESKNYLEQHPAKFETLLGQLLIQGNAEALTELLPNYQQVPNYDPSVVDWGNAIIAAKNGKLDQAVELYRKLNARLPDVSIIRFQMAMALFYNQQYQAAQTEFEKLRSSTELTEDINVINNYLEAISEMDNWDFYGSVSYLDDPNITNSPEQGTSLVRENGSVFTSSTPKESGKGLNYSLNGDKKWQSDNKYFTALHLNSFGKYYWDNENFNDVTVGVGTGVGYQNATTELEIGPFYSKRWYAQGTNGDGDLHNYLDTKGVKLDVSQWLSPKIRYQGLARYGKTSYIDKYKHNDGKDLLLANTTVYFPNGQQFWTLGLDYSNKNAEEDSSSFDRTGVRVGWGQTWPKGYSTKFDLGYAQRDYEAEDFFGIQRENKEYSAGVSFWKRDLTLFGLTPRLEVDYFKVNSNSPFEEYDKTNVSVELTKSF